MRLTVVGVSHHGAPLDKRERLTYPTSEVLSALEAVLSSAGAQEGVLLSTCNRTELYLVEGNEDAAPAAWAELSRRLGEDASVLGYVRRDREAVAHLFRVASGLDSMILGEAQIHGQVRDAWEASRARSGTALNRLFQSALLVAGRVRSETNVSRGAASVSSAALQLSKQIFGSLAGRQAMVFGAGDMADLALECLASEGVRASVVVNRTHERAVALAQRHGARAVELHDSWDALTEVDLLLCSTSAPHAVITVERVRESIAARGDRPLCILDIAVPRDVEREVGRLQNVYLYDLDDLQSVVSQNLERRRGELPAAEELIGTELERYWQWLAGLAAVPVLTRFRSRMDQLRERELSQLMRRLPSLSDEERAHVEQFSRALMNKFLHDPSVRLRMAAAEEAGLGIVEAVRYLFALDEGSTTAPTQQQQPTDLELDEEPSLASDRASTPENAR